MENSPQVVNTWCRFLKLGSLGRMENIKYSAFNIVPIQQRGSIEIRCGKAADSPEFPITWAMFLNSFANWAKEKFPNPALIGPSLSERGAIDIFEEICDYAGMEFFRDFFSEVVKGRSRHEFNSICLESFRHVQEISQGFPWDKWMPLIEREHVPNPFLMPL